MDVKNHNTNRKKRVVRKRLKTAVFIAVFVGILLTVFRYLGFVSKTVYEESVSHLTEIFHQSDNMLSELTNKNLTYLHIWGEYLQNTSDESEIREYIEKAQEDAGFLDFYFLSADGNYKMATGETGYLGLQENIEDEIRQGNDVITNATVPGKSQLLVFATPKPHGSYQGFEYDAIAIAYENSDIVNVLNISAFNGNAQSYVVHPDGRVVVDHSSESWGLAIVMVVKVFQKYVEAHALHTPATWEWIVIAVLYAVYLTDFIVTVAVIQGLNKKLTRLDKVRSDLRIVSDKLSDTLATTTIGTAAELRDATAAKRINKKIQTYLKIRHSTNHSLLLLTFIKPLFISHYHSSNKKLT
jgi:hypothetical protein